MANSRAAATGVTVNRNVSLGVTVASVTGRVGIEEANELQRRFDEVFKSGRPWVIISMRDVEFICSAGMGTLLSAVGEARKGGGEIIFTDVSAKVRTIFEFLDIWDYITAAPDREAAMELVATGKRMQARHTAASLVPSFLEDDLKTKLNAGIRASKEGKLKNALAYFNAVIKSDKNNAAALTWKSNVLERLGQLGEARRLYKRVCEIGRGDRNILSYARTRLEKLNQKLQLATDRDKAFEQLKAAARRFAEMPYRLPDIFNPEPTVEEGAAPFLACYRTWDAGAGYGEDYSERSLARGGGYYFRLGGRGVALDPGRNFLARFAAAGRRLADIEAIIVAHAGWDFVADLEPLLEAYDRYNKLGAGPVRRVEVFVNGGVYKKNYSWLSTLKDVVSKLTVLYPGHVYRVGTAALDVKPAELPENRSDDALGLMFTAGTAIFAYVADAPCSDVDVLATLYRGARDGVLLVHIGDIPPEGKEGFDETGESLGVESVGRLLSEVRPTVGLLGKMPNVTDPVALSAAITKTTKVRCFPVDVGFTLDLETAEVVTGAGPAAAAEVEVVKGEDRRLRYETKS